MNSVKLAELIQIASAIWQLEDLIHIEENPAEWKKVKAALPTMIEEFNKKRAAYVDLILKERSGDDAVEYVFGQLTDFRAKSDDSWNRPTDYVIENLIPYLTKESAKSPGYRKAVKAMPWVLATIGIFVYFGVRMFSAVDLSSPIESREGLRQRAAAMEKFVRHDDFMHTEVRRGGWIKGLLFWPIEPTGAEMSGATEFAGLTLAGLGVLREKNEACSDLPVGQGENLSKKEIEFAGEVAEFLRSDRMTWSDDPISNIFTAIEAVDPCDKIHTE